MRDDIKYVANIKNVQEISLVGLADLRYWQQRLPKRFTLLENNGRAQLLIIAATMKFMGIRFHELSFSLFISQDILGDSQEKSTEASYLLHAFNSSRLFALSERLFFSTPYYHGHCCISLDSQLTVELELASKKSFAACMSMQSDSLKRKPVRSGEAGWGGPVFLPSNNLDPLSSSKFFYAQISGTTDIYAFDDSLDRITIDPNSKCEVLRSLVESNFTGHEWSIRKNATHAKSKTYCVNI